MASGLDGFRPVESRENDEGQDEETRTDPKPKMFPKPLFVSASMSLVMTDHEQAVKYSYLPFVSSPGD
jgi:hypothetical protein